MAPVKPKPLSDYREYPLPQMAQRAADFYAVMKRRRTVRDFSDRPVPREIIADCLRAAASAPSGANQQPWQFVVVSDAGVKRKIRRAAERVESEFYSRDATRKWVDALASLGTGPQKPFLEEAPHLIAIFAQRHGYLSDGRKKKHYYVRESVGIATGMLITALHNAGLVSLTYTPAKMGFLTPSCRGPPTKKRL